MKKIALLFLVFFHLPLANLMANEAQESLFNDEMLMLDKEFHFLNFSFLDTAPLFIAHRHDGSVFRINEHIGRLDKNPKLQRVADLHGTDPRKFVVLSFYASNCEPCKNEVLDLLMFYGSISATRDDILLVFVGMDTEKDKAKNFFRDNNITLPERVEVLLNPARNAFAPGKLYNVEKLPSLFVISKDGEIIFDQTGHKAGYPIDEALRNIIVHYEQINMGGND